MESGREKGERKKEEEKKKEARVTRTGEGEAIELNEGEGWDV